MKSHLRKPNFQYLLAGILAVLFIDPILRDLFNYSSPFLNSLIFSSTLILGVWSLHESKVLFRTGLGLIAVSLVIAIIISRKPELVTLRVIDLLILLIFCAMSFVFILEEITHDVHVDLNRVTGGICLYLLLGLIFAIVHSLVETFLPGSYRHADVENYLHSDMFYFSFVTLTTLGYGDITPIRPLAKTVSIFEAVVGVFYMSVLIGSMIGLLLNKARK